MPIDVLALATAHGREIKERELPEGQAGNTFNKGGQDFIVVNSNDDPFRRRFTVLHELAHHILELPSNHGTKISTNELERFAGRPPEEKLCDVFAAECLVPWHLIKPIVSNSVFSVEVVHQLSERFQASKRCIASSFVRASRDPIAYVYSENGRVQNVVASACLRDKRIFIQSGMVPTNSAAALALEKNTQVETADLDASDWSSSDAALNFGCYEEVLHMSHWRQTLSLLSFDELRGSPENKGVDNEDDGLLSELTGQLEWRKR